MSKVLFIGPAPGKGFGDPLAGASGRRLANLAGLDLEAFLDQFERINLLDEWPGKAGKGDKFDLPAAREIADKLREDLGGRKAVLLGRGVAAAFRLVPDDYSWFQPIQIPPDLEVAVMPHPSGISHWWNDKANVEAASDFMKRVRIGLLAFARKRGKKLGRPEKFTPEQVGLALAMSHGIPLDAAKLLAEETGTACSRINIVHAIRRDPELDQVRRDARQAIGDQAESIVVKALEAGDATIALKLLRSEMYADRGYNFGGRVDVNVSGRVDHRHAHIHKIDAELDLDRFTPEQLAAIEEYERTVGAASRPESGRQAGGDRPLLGPPRQD